MNPQQELEILERIIDELIAGIQDVLQSGEILSDEFQGMLADELEATMSRINQLRGEIGRQNEAAQQPLPAIPSGATLGAPPSADVQLLWILAGQQEQPFISYLREYPSPATQELLNNPAELSRTIDYLNRIMPPGEQPFINGIQHADLNSSNIWGTVYNAKTGQMKVRFQGGSEYEYDGVPANIYRAFSKGNASAKTKGKNKYGEWWVGKNPSLGAAMNQYIKAAKFPYRKIR